jgi:CRISPR-associated endonuclease Csn1
MPGPVIRSVFVRRRNTQSGIKLRRGAGEAHADLATMVRVDVLSKAGKFYLVPIYAWQVADRERFPVPPMRAIEAHKPEAEWPVMDSSYRFTFSMFPGSYIEAVNRSSETIAGYYRQTNRSTSAYQVSPPHDSQKLLQTGPRLLSSMQKFAIDRLGQRHEIKWEPREWHGAVCTSASPAD